MEQGIGQLHNVALCADVSCLIVQFYRLTLTLKTLWVTGRFFLVDLGPGFLVCF